MTNATVLADALVEAGIGSPYGLKLSNWYSIPGDSFGASGVTADEFITDWRVAGKVLESMPSFEMWEVGDGHQVVFDQRFCNINESLPRAIIEAWYKARQ